MDVPIDKDVVYPDENSKHKLKFNMVNLMHEHEEKNKFEKFVKCTSMKKCTFNASNQNSSNIWVLQFMNTKIQ